MAFGEREKTNAFIVAVAKICGHIERLAFVESGHLERDRIHCIGSFHFLFLFVEQLQSEGHLVLRTAFSRDQKHKIYVQDLILQDAKLLWTTIDAEGGHLYICGDARYMAHDVHKAFLQILQTEGGLSPEAADQYLQNLEASGRYQKDVWVT